MNLIDFGLSIKTEDSFLNYQYIYFPPEYFLINYICGGLKEFYNLNKRKPGFPKPLLNDYYEIINYVIDNKTCDILIPILTKFLVDLNLALFNLLGLHVPYFFVAALGAFRMEL